MLQHITPIPVGSILTNRMESRLLAGVTTIEIFAILVEFKDVKHDPQYTLTDFNNMMTSVGIYTGPPPNLHPQDKPIYGSIRDYWNDMSNGQVIFTGGVWNASDGTINWVTLDYNKIEYHNNTRNLRADVLAKVQNEPTPGPNLIRAIIYAGNEYDGGGLNPSSAGYEYIDSEEFHRPTTMPHEEPTDLQFFKNIGVACHELGHAAFGFPDRYGIYNTLQWDLMGAGQKSGPDGEMACPSTLNPFDRKSENWIYFQSFSGTQATKPFTYNYSSPQIFQVATSGNEYFLIENRRNQVGSSGTFDLWLPAQGVLVWHVRNSTGAGTINLIEADNTQSEANLSGDPFPGSSNNTNLNDFTTPNCKYASSSNSSMVLHYISAPASTMTANLGSKWFGILPLTLTWSGTVISENLTVPRGKTH
jgi:M6 family metalloprotease-like protein